MQCFRIIQRGQPYFFLETIRHYYNTRKLKINHGEIDPRNPISIFKNNIANPTNGFLNNPTLSSCFLLWFADAILPNSASLKLKLFATSDIARERHMASSELHFWRDMERWRGEWTKSPLCYYIFLLSGYTGIDCFI